MSFAQDSVEIAREWTSYSQIIDVARYAEHDFRVSAMIRKDLPKNDGSNAVLWARIEKKDGSRGFFQNQIHISSATNDWQKFSVNGTIDTDASNLYFGAFCQNNGDFYYDDFKLEVRLENGNWKSLYINNPGFEELANSDFWDEGIRKSEITQTKHFEINYSSNKSFSGGKALHIKGSNIIGNNEENGHRIDINEVSLYFEVYGKGEPMLLIHGNGQSASAFLQQVEEFEKYYMVVVVDCRGRGNSTYQKDVELTYDLQVEDMKYLLDHLKIESANIVGWSDGGIIGLLMAMKYPDKVKKLIAMGANINPEGLINLEDFRKTISELKSEKDSKFDLNIDLYSLMVNHPQLTFENLSVIRAPTLIMAGDKDVIKNMHTVKMYEAIPNAQLAILPNETHYLPSENSKLFNELVLNFLRE